MKNNRNLFVSFEGPEASGKSSQIRLLAKYLKKNRIPHIVTREPGGTKIGEKLRKIFLLLLKDRRQVGSHLKLNFYLII